MLGFGDLRQCGFQYCVFCKFDWRQDSVPKCSQCCFLFGLGLIYQRILRRQDRTLISEPAICQIRPVRTQSVLFNRTYRYRRPIIWALIRDISRSRNSTRARKKATKRFDCQTRFPGNFCNQPGQMASGVKYKSQQR